MSKFKTQPINKDPNWRYRPSFDTDIRRTIAKARAKPPLVSSKEVLEVDEVQDAQNPHNVSTLTFPRRMRSY